MVLDECIIIAYLVANHVPYKCKRNVDISLYNSEGTSLLASYFTSSGIDFPCCSMVGEVCGVSPCCIKSLHMMSLPVSNTSCRHDRRLTTA